MPWDEKCLSQFRKLSDAPVSIKAVVALQSQEGGSAGGSSGSESLGTR